jgi:hydroxymethylbilane synthase
MALTHLRIGTRGSALALVQTKLVSDALTQTNPGLTIENIIIKTEGDINLAPIPLDTVGKAWFTSEIDQALADRRIDLAAHSLKDLPLTPANGLAMTVALKREDPRDVLISRVGQTLAELPHGAVVGTDSTRRRAQLLHRRPDLKVTSLRGNVQTRLRKLHDEDYDAIVLAAAGLARLGQLEAVTEFLDPTGFIPAIGQGALAVEVREDHHELRRLLRRLEDPATVAAVGAERTFSATIGGGCKLPVGCYAQINAGQVTLHAMIAGLDGADILHDTVTGPLAQAHTLAQTLASTMLEKCPFEFKPTTNAHKR